MNKQKTIESIEHMNIVLLSSHVLLITMIFFSLSTRQSMPGVSLESLIDLYVIFFSLSFSLFRIDDVLNLSTSSVDCLFLLSFYVCVCVFPSAAARFVVLSYLLYY